MNQLDITKSFPASYRRLMALIGPLVIAAAVVGLALFVATAPSYATRAGDRLLSAEPVREERGLQRDSVLSPPAISSPVTATVMYTITDLGAFYPYKINDEGQLLGIMNGSSALWLPEPAYGLPAGLNDLSFLDVWIISDINNDLMLVGTAYVPEGCDDDYYAASVQRIFDEDASTWQWITTILPTQDPWDLSWGAAINNNGVIVGRAEDACTEEGEESEGRMAARWQSGAMLVLGTLDGDESYAYAINDLGQIVGESSTGSGFNPPEHAFLWTNGSMIDLGTLPGTTESKAVDLNDLGQVIGSSDGRPFLWLPAPDYGLEAGMHDLASFSPDPNPGYVYGINSQGQIVGDVNFGDGRTAYLWDKGTAYQLNDLINPDAGWDLQRATDVNEKGQIVGFGNYGGFLLTPQKKWTVMLYLDGDNDLAWTYPPIFNQLELAADNPNVNVIVYWDDPSGATYYEVQFDGVYTPNENVWDQGQLDSSAPSTLSDFATWAMDNYPADNYALFLSDHGSGLGGGLVEDSPYSIMDLPEMQQALATIHQATGEKIDVLYMDMCLMGMIEDAYQFREYADYYVSSEYLQWAFAEPYSQYIAGIGPNSGPAEVAIHFASVYAGVAESSGKPYTIAAADIAKLSAVVTATNQLGAALDNDLDTISVTLSTVSQIVQRFDNKQFEGEPPFTINSNDTYVDLYDFARLVEQTMGGSPAITAAAQAVMNSVNNFVIYEAHGSTTAPSGQIPVPVDLDNSHGVSIFFPAMASIFYDEEDYDFAVGANWTTGGATPALVPQSGTWGAMLVSYFQATQPGGPVDDTPPVPRPRLIPFDQRVYLPVVIRN